MRASSLVFVLLLGLAACKSEAKPEPKPKPTTASGTVGADGVRTIPIEASAKGYDPDRIPGTPGEKLKLVFTRTGGGECNAELKTPDGKRVALPMNTAVEVLVTVPRHGEVKFACGMDMMFGVVVAERT